MIEIHEVSHWFGSKQVLDDINLRVEDSEIIAIMGSSGGGKTTLLRCISGLLVPTQGTIKVAGFDSAKEPDKVRAKLGLVFQSAALFDYLTVAENVLFGIRRQRHLSGNRLREIVQEMLEMVAMEGTENLMPAELSGGMKKRVGLARALAMEPDILLYDEPTSGLDPVTAYAIDQLIVDTARRTGVTSVVVSHDVSSVFRVADRVAFLASGKLIFVGPTAEFRNQDAPEISELVQKARAEALS